MMKDTSAEKLNPEKTEICQHFWSIDPAGNGVCKKCGSRIRFYTSVYDALKQKHQGKKGRFYRSGQSASK